MPYGHFEHVAKAKFPGDLHRSASYRLTRPLGFASSDLQSKALLSSRHSELHLRLYILSVAFGIFLRCSLILRLSAEHSS